MFDRVLGSLCGAEDGTRVEVVQVSQHDGAPTLELRLLRQADGLGWQVHRRIQLAAGQVGELRAALNLMDADAQKKTAHKGRSCHLRLVCDEGRSVG